MVNHDLHEDFEFSWHLRKAAANLLSHGVTFKEASLVFSDYMMLDLGEDRRADYGEQRFNVIGRSGAKLLFVTHSYRGDLIHIISARLAERHEKRFWNSHNPPEGF